MQNKTISFETAEASVMQTWKSLLKQTNPYFVPILLPMIEHFKPLFKEFYDLGVDHGKTAQVSEGRTDFEIISQTIELVDIFAHANRFQRDKSMRFPFESENPRNIEWWRLACQVQELLTDTDPNNCDFEEYKAMIEAQEQTND